MENLRDYMDIVQFALMVGGVIFGIFFYFSKPDQRASRRLDKIETECPMKHSTINSEIATMTKALEFIKENHLRHMEGDIAGINEKIARMEGRDETMINLLKDVLSKK